jgi:hypothetical protein
LISAANESASSFVDLGTKEYLVRKVALLVAALLLLALPAVSGGGLVLKSPEDRYEVGDSALFVGYLEASLAWAGEGPWTATLHPADESASESLLIEPLTVEPTGIGGYLSHRFSLSFTVPGDLAPGQYFIAVHNESGDGIGGASIAVGVDPEWDTPSYELALDDPLIDQLPGDALIVGAFPSVTAAQLRAGVYPEGAEDFMMQPELLEELRVGTIGYPVQASTTTSVPPTTAGPSVTTALEPPLPLAASTPPTIENTFDWMAGVVAALIALALVALGRRLLSERRALSQESTDRVSTRL